MNNVTTCIDCDSDSITWSIRYACWLCCNCGRYFLTDHESDEVETIWGTFDVGGES